MDHTLISAEALKDTMLNERVVVLRALMRDPVSGEADNGESDFLPASQNFELDGAGSDHDSGLPHTLPAPEALSLYLGQLGVTAECQVVIYDNRGIYSSPRVWWMLKAMGHQKVRVLNGGLPAWKQHYPVNAETEIPAANTVYQATPQPDWFVDHQVVGSALGTEVQIIDARSEARFSGKAAEPRPGVRSGHMPGAINIPFNTLLNGTEFKPVSQLKQIFEHAGVDLRRPIVCSCGSGVTACIIGMAARLCGADKVSVYDGSWAEWGADSRFPLETSS